MQSPKSFVRGQLLYSFTRLLKIHGQSQASGTSSSFRGGVFELSVNGRKSLMVSSYGSWLALRAWHTWLVEDLTGYSRPAAVASTAFAKAAACVLYKTSGLRFLETLHFCVLRRAPVVRTDTSQSLILSLLPPPNHLSFQRKATQAELGYHSTRQGRPGDVTHGGTRRR